MEDHFQYVAVVGFLRRKSVECWEASDQENPVASNVSKHSVNCVARNVNLAYKPVGIPWGRLLWTQAMQWQRLRQERLRYERIVLGRSSSTGLVPSESRMERRYPPMLNIERCGAEKKAREEGTDSGVGM